MPDEFELDDGELPPSGEDEELELDELELEDELEREELDEPYPDLRSEEFELDDGTEPGSNDEEDELELEDDEPFISTTFPVRVYPNIPRARHPGLR